MTTPLIFFAVLATLALVAAVWDIARRTIPNWLNLLVLVAGAVSLFFLPEGSSVWSHLGHFAIALIVSMAFFKFGLWGGGDAKFYSAVALWFPLIQAPLLALITALAGLVLVVLSFIAHRMRKASGKYESLPYGVAIAVGAILLQWVSNPL